MVVILIIAVVVLLMFFGNQKANDFIAKENVSLGGFRKNYPIFTNYLESFYKMTFVNDTGREFSYFKNLYNENGLAGKLFIGIRLEYDKPMLFSKFLSNSREELQGMRVSAVDYFDISLIDKAINISTKEIQKKYSINIDFAEVLAITEKKAKEVESQLEEIKRKKKKEKERKSEFLSINSVQESEPLNPEVIKIHTQIKEVLKTNAYASHFIGFEKIIKLTQPTDKEIQDYTDLYEKYSDTKQGLNTEEKVKLDALTKSLNEWQILDGSYDKNHEITLAELIRQLQKIKN